MLDFLRRVISLWRKELLAILKDPANRVILVIFALPWWRVFCSAMPPPMTSTMFPTPCSIKAGAPPPRNYVARLDGTGVFRRVATLETPGEIAKIIDSRESVDGDPHRSPVSRSPNRRGVQAAGAAYPGRTQLEYRGYRPFLMSPLLSKTSTPPLRSGSEAPRLRSSRGPGTTPTSKRAGSCCPASSRRSA